VRKIHPKKRSRRNRNDPGCAVLALLGAAKNISLRQSGPSEKREMMVGDTKHHGGKTVPRFAKTKKVRGGQGVKRKIQLIFLYPTSSNKRRRNRMGDPERAQRREFERRGKHDSFLKVKREKRGKISASLVPGCRRRSQKV